MKTSMFILAVMALLPDAPHAERPASAPPPTPVEQRAEDPAADKPALTFALYQTQAALLFRSLTYLRSLERSEAPKVLVAVLHGGSGSGRKAGNRLLEAFEVFHGHKVQGVPFATVDVTYSNPEAWAQFVHEQRPVAVVIGDDLQELLPEVLSVTRQQKLLSMSGSESLGSAGVSISAVTLDGKPRILLNAAGSAAEEQRFSADFMQLVHLVK